MTNTPNLLQVYPVAHRHDSQYHLMFGRNRSDLLDDCYGKAFQDEDSVWEIKSIDARQPIHTRLPVDERRHSQVLSPTGVVHPRSCQN